MRERSTQKPKQVILQLIHVGLSGACSKDRVTLILQL